MIKVLSFIQVSSSKPCMHFCSSICRCKWEGKCYTGSSCLKMWSGLNWLRLRSSGGALWHCKHIFGFLYFFISWVIMALWRRQITLFHLKFLTWIGCAMAQAVIHWSLVMLGQVFRWVIWSSLVRIIPKLHTFISLMRWHYLILAIDKVVQ